MAAISSTHALQNGQSITCHKIPLDEFIRSYKTNSRKGLTHAKANARFSHDGPNRITRRTHKSEWKKFMKFMYGSFAIILLIGASLCILSCVIRAIHLRNFNKEYLYLGCLLVAVVVISATFSYWQESRSTEILDSFTKMIPQYASVIREGEIFHINSTFLVVGDLVQISSGDHVPADIRIIDSQGLKVDNSMLTGESEPVSRNANFTNDNPFETKNLVFSSSIVTEGAARGIVFASGDKTVVGRLAHTSTELQNTVTPLAKEIRNFIDMISCLTAFFAIVFFVTALCMGYRLLEAVLFMMSIIVANMPEGLLPTIMITLSVTAKRMVKRNCLVKNLEAVETLGSTSTICSDKTGTLTQNRLTVSHMWYDNQIFNLETSENRTVRNVVRTLSPGFQALARCAILCCRADFKRGQQKTPVIKRKVVGDSFEAAILKAMELEVGSTKAIRLNSKKVAEIPFNSKNKYQISIHQNSDTSDSRYLLVMKGAPERILALCETILYNGEETLLDEEILEELTEIYHDLGDRGERVLGFCDFMLPLDEYPVGYEFDVEAVNFPTDKLRFVGFMSMMDPPRASVPDAVARCRSAGIKVIMVTGDHPSTAKAVAIEVGILSVDPETVQEAASSNISEKNAILVHGNDLSKMSKHELDSILTRYAEIVFARISPQQKLNIVEGLQRTGAIVAATGDGVNDALALKKADIGISMGISGSDVSKEAADMVLLDDNFASIVTAIEEGRMVFVNIKKCIAYSLTSNIAEVFPFVLYMLLGIPLPLGVVTILCIDLGTDILPAISLAYEKPESNLMKQQPRNPQTDKLVDKKLFLHSYANIGAIEAVAGLFAYFVVMAENGFLPSKLICLRREWDSAAINDLEDSYGQEWTYRDRKNLEYTCQTAFFVAIVIAQWANLIICKTRRLSIVDQGMSNHVLNFALVLETALAICFCYCPGISTFLNLYPINLSRWFLALPFALLILAYDETRRYYIRKYPGGWAEKEIYY